jgi:radical SAM superfamily enzyme YgiQ (UPF0313 family)
MSYDAVIIGDSQSVLHNRPLGMHRITNQLRSLGYTAKCIWAWNHVGTQLFCQIIKRHLDSNIKMVGISATIMQDKHIDGEMLGFGITLDEVKTRLEFIKQYAPNAKIVVGGIAEQTKDNFYGPHTLPYLNLVDYFVNGQGESIVEKIMQSIDDNKKILSHDILTPKVLSDKFIPFNDFSKNLDLYQVEDCLDVGEPISLELSRGCVFRCKFCSYDLTNKSYGDFTKCEENLYKEFSDNYERHGTQSYVIVDDLLNDSDEKVDLIYRTIQKLKFPIKFVGYLRLDLVRHNPNNLEKLKKAGLIGAFFGIETLNDRSGRSVGKGLGAKRINEALDIVYNIYGDEFFGEAGLILGLPHDDENTKYEILDWANQSSVTKIIKKFSIGPLIMNSRSGQSDIDKNPEKFGYVIDNTISTDNTHHDNWVSPTMSFAQAVKDSDWLKTEFEKTRPFQFVSTFYLPYLAYVYGDQDKFFQMAFGKIPMEENLIENLKQKSYKKRIEYLKRLEKFSI